MNVISPGCLLFLRFFHWPILFRESNSAVISASVLAKDKMKNGVPHILESHPRKQRARMGHSLQWDSDANTKTGRPGHPAPG